MEFTVPLFDLNFDGAEEAAVADAVRSRWISMGERSALFEQRFAQHLGARHAVALANCTAALHLALEVLGVGEGDEVIVPSLTFVATVNAVRYVRATPVFADITGPGDFSMDPEDVRRKITPRTRAILPMHFGGFACNMDALSAIAREHNLRLVEDAAHAPDSRWGDAMLGTLGDIGCFSFFSNKNMTCAEGGMLVTADDKLAARARLMRSHGMTTLSYERAKGHATRYDVVDTGYNYRLDDIRAALALVQLDKLKADTAARARLRPLYLERLRGHEDAYTIPYLDHRHPSSNYIFMILLARGDAGYRDQVRQRMAEQGIQTSVHYPAVHRFSYYQPYATTPLPRTDYVTDHEITLPLYGTLSEEKLERVVQALHAAL